jgi:hypothetical protein
MTSAFGVCSAAQAGWRLETVKYKCTTAGLQQFFFFAFLFYNQTHKTMHK